MSRVRAKRALSLPTIVLRGSRRLPRRWILTLHDVGEHPWAYPPAAFDDLLAWMAAETEPAPLAPRPAGY